MTYGNGHKHYVSPQMILDSIAKIRRYDDDDFIDEIVALWIEPDGELTLHGSHPDEYDNSIPGCIWNGSIIRINCGRSVVPRLLADWLQTQVDLLRSISSGLEIHTNDYGDRVGRLSDMASLDLGLLEDKLSELAWDPHKRINVISYAADHILGPVIEECEGLATAEEVAEWARTMVSGGQPYMDDDYGMIIVDLDEALEYVLDYWYSYRRDVESRAANSA